MSQGDNGEWTYSVHLEFLDETWCVEEQQLATTGLQAKESEVLTEQHLKVTVDETGRSKIKKS